MLKIIVENFKNQHNTPITIEKLSKKFSLPLKNTEKLLSMLHTLSLVELVYIDAKKGTKRIRAYQPAFDIHQMKIGFILNQLEHFSVENNFSVSSHKKEPYIQYFSGYLQEMEQYLESSAYYNKPIADMEI